MGTRNSKLAPCGDSYLLDVSGGAEPLSGFWSFGLTDDHDLFAAAGSVLKIHCLQFGNKSLRTLGRTELPYAASRVFSAPSVCDNDELDLVALGQQFAPLHLASVEKQLLALVMLVSKESEGTLHGLNV